MLVLLTIIHVLVCIFLIIVVLLQSGKAADLAGAFGGMGSQTAFGPRGSATLLSKATTVSAVVFMITSLSLSILATRNAGSVGNTVLDKAKQSAPAKSGQTPAPAAPSPVPQTSKPGSENFPAVSNQPVPAPAQAPPAQGQKKK
jgi:preprotein translocase subunit SecG